MSLTQGFPSTFSATQTTIDVLHNLDNETKKIYNDVNAIMAADGHSHTGNGSDGAKIRYENLTNLPDIIGISGGTLTGAIHQPNPVTITSALGVLTLLETSNSFIAEGSEAITSIAGWTVGTVVVRWNTVRALTYNSTSLILQNAIDRTTAIGDIGIYEMTSAGVRELHYFPISTLTQLKKDLNATGTAPIYACRAWVNFNGVPLAGTYSQSGTTVTVTMTAHGLSVGDNVNLSITSGTGVSGSYTVLTVVSANIFIYTAGTSLTTSGNITRNIYIRGSGNVSSITDNGVGDYTVNFAVSMPDANYTIVSNSFGVASQNGVTFGHNSSYAPLTTSFRTASANVAGTIVDITYGHLSIFSK